MKKEEFHYNFPSSFIVVTINWYKIHQWLFISTGSSHSLCKTMMINSLVNFITSWPTKHSANVLHLTHEQTVPANYHSKGSCSSSDKLNLITPSFIIYILHFILHTNCQINKDFRRKIRSLLPDKKQNLSFPLPNFHFWKSEHHKMHLL